MVKCILDGKVIELGGGQLFFEKGNPEPIEDPKIETIIECIVDGEVLYIKDSYSSFTPPEPINEKEIDEFGKNTKVVADCLDENGRPRLKIVYLHTDWSDKDGHVSSKWLRRFLDAERDGNDEYCLETGNNVDPPRVIVVKQDKDYWPESELKDPLVFERRAAKEKEYKEVAPYKYKPDYKEVDPIHYFGDDGSRSTDDIGDCSRRMYENYINPDLPGCEFLMTNISKSALIQWKRASYPKKPKKINSTLMEKRTLKKREKYAAGDFSLDGPIPKKRRCRPTFYGQGESNELSLCLWKENFCSQYAVVSLKSRATEQNLLAHHIYSEFFQRLGKWLATVSNSTKLPCTKL